MIGEKTELPCGESPLCSDSSSSLNGCCFSSAFPPPQPPPSSQTLKMGLISRALKITAAGSVASVGIFFGATRNDVFEPMDTTDPIFSSPFFAKYNPNRNPTLHDKCVRRIPLDKIKPELLEKKGKLVEAFCAGVWGGMGELGAHCPARDHAIN